MARQLSLAKSVAEAGGVDAWNSRSPELTTLQRLLGDLCRAETVEDVVTEVQGVMSLGAKIWAYMYMRALHARNPNLFYGALIAHPTLLMPVVYTPAVGEACQKFGRLPMQRRGCYLSVTDRGNLKQVLQEYAEAELQKGADGRYLCDCIVFSDGGRVLGLGDLGAWGMGIPIGKLDLYTVCAGFDPSRTIPVIIDVGNFGPQGNTDRLVIRDDPLYTGLKRDRVTHVSEAGTKVNSAYYGEDSMIKEFMEAATELFGRTCLLQFEDFNSNDAFPLLAEYRSKFLTYNDDIQGTAAVAVAGLLGAIKLRDPACTDLLAQLRRETFVFYGAGSANLGTVKLLTEAGVPWSNLLVANSRGLIWADKDGRGSFRNEDQRAVAQEGEPDYDTRDLVKLIQHAKPSCLVGAVGVAPGCFTQAVVEAMVAASPSRPIIFALSNPMTQAEITAKQAYDWSGGKAIYGSGTAFPPRKVNGATRVPGQVNNVYIFPGVSYGAVRCEAKSIPDQFFLVAAEAVARSLSDSDMAVDRVLPGMDRLRFVALEVATAVVLEAQNLGLAGKRLGDDREQVRAALQSRQWQPELEAPHFGETSGGSSSTRVRARRQGRWRGGQGHPGLAAKVWLAGLALLWSGWRGRGPHRAAQGRRAQEAADASLFGSRARPSRAPAHRPTGSLLVRPAPPRSHISVGSRLLAQ